MISHVPIFLTLCWLALVSGIYVRHAPNDSRQYAKAGNNRNNKQYSLEFPKATTELTLDLLKELSKKPGNVVFSPTSIGMLLSMLQQGANGKTRNELNEVLHASPEESEKGYTRLVQSTTQERIDEEGTVSDTANRMYVNPSFAIRDKFRKRIQVNYSASLETLKTDPTLAAAEINQWVKEATHGHIMDIVSPESLDANTALVMASAMFFKGEWEKKFKETQLRMFRASANEQFEVPFMISERELTAGREKSHKWIELPYKGRKYSMYLIRTIKRSFQDMFEDLTRDTLTAIFRSKSKKNVKVRMPAFKIEHKPAIKDALIAMGLKTLFTPKANLSNIAEQLSVTHMAHEAYLDVNEEGTEAAAATAGVITTLSANWDPYNMEFGLDEPFLAFVVDKVREIPIMAARIADPRK